MILATTDAIKAEFGLSLFGFDVILPFKPLIDVSNQSIEGDQFVYRSHTKPMVIDINYFPSYKEVKDFPLKLNRVFKKKSIS